MRYLFYILLFITISLGVYSLLKFSSKEVVLESKAKIVQVKRGPLQVLIESNGIIEPQKEVAVKCEASGEVTKLPVDVSDIVKKGDLLVQLDPRDEELLVKRAEVDAVVSKAKLKQVKLALKIAQQNLVNSRVRFSAELTSAEVLVLETGDQLVRSEQLYEKKMGSKKAFQIARTIHAKATAALEIVKSSLKDLDTKELSLNLLTYDICIAEQEVITSEINLDESKERLRETTVKSSINGIVTAKNVQVGQIISSGTSNVGGGTTVLNLADMSRTFVFVSVDESDIGRVRKGQSVTVTADAFPDKEFYGSVVRVGTKGISVSNIVTFEVKVEITSKEKELLKPGMTANVEIMIVNKKETLLVLSDAVQQSSKGWFVSIIDDDRIVHRREVAIGDTDGEWTEIISGLHQGEQLQIVQRKSSIWSNSDKNSEHSLTDSILGGRQPARSQGPGGQR